jgi:hypothetical protein
MCNSPPWGGRGLEKRVSRNLLASDWESGPDSSQTPVGQWERRVARGDPLSDPAAQATSTGGEKVPAAWARAAPEVGERVGRDRDPGAASTDEDAALGVVGVDRRGHCRGNVGAVGRHGGVGRDHEADVAGGLDVSDGGGPRQATGVIVADGDGELHRGAPSNRHWTGPATACAVMPKPGNRRIGCLHSQLTYVRQCFGQGTRGGGGTPVLPGAHRRTPAGRYRSWASCFPPTLRIGRWLSAGASRQDHRGSWTHDGW